MKRFLILAGTIALTATQLAWAQPGQPPGPPGQAGAVGRGQEERRGAREDFRREQMDRRQERGQERGSNAEQGGRHMSPDERRELRQQIRDHGRSIYRDRQ